MTYGFLGTFQSKDDFVTALEQLRTQNIEYDCFSSQEIDEVLLSPDSVYLKQNKVKKAALMGAFLGLVTAIGMQWDSTVRDTPLNVAGKPLFSWPAFIPIAFVLTVLFTGVSLMIALFIQLKFPEPYHPVFNARSYNLSLGNFTILIYSRESPTRPSLNESQIRELFLKLGASEIEEVSW